MRRRSAARRSWPRRMSGRRSRGRPVWTQCKRRVGRGRADRRGRGVEDGQGAVHADAAGGSAAAVTVRPSSPLVIAASTRIASGVPGAIRGTGGRKDPAAALHPPRRPPLTAPHYHHLAHTLGMTPIIAGIAAMRAGMAAMRATGPRNGRGRTPGAVREDAAAPPAAPPPSPHAVPTPHRRPGRCAHCRQDDRHAPRSLRCQRPRGLVGSVPGTVRGAGDREHTGRAEGKLCAAMGKMPGWARREDAYWFLRQSSKQMSLLGSCVERWPL